MKNLIPAAIACLAMTATLTDSLSAHGGRYRGPTDVVPRDPGGRVPRPSTGGGPSGPNGPVTPRGGNPAGPSPSGPSTGGNSPLPGGRRGGPNTGGIQLDDDLTQWQFWWEFNQDPYLRLKEAVHASGPRTHSFDFYTGAGYVDRGNDTLKPTAAQIHNVILPALEQAMTNTDQRDIASSCMIAIAKIGEDHEDFAILPLFRSRLRSRDQEIREIAALACGLSQKVEAMGTLVELSADTVIGRQLCDRSEVDDRTRAFAAHGLGLIANATASTDVKRRAFDVLRGLLHDPDVTNRNVHVAALSSIGLLKPDVASAKGRALLADCLATLEEFYDRKLGRGRELIQAHVPTAVARLVRDGGADEELVAALTERFVADLRGDGARHASIRQSCAVALGRIARPHTAGSEHASVSEALIDYVLEGKDHQARYFALIALGEIGGENNRAVLLEVLTRGQKVLERPWAAIALGIYCHNVRTRDGVEDVDQTVGRQLHKQLMDGKTPSARSAFAIALGLCRFTSAADDLESLLQTYKKQANFGGYLCIGLALMQHSRAIGTIENVVRASVRKPELLRQSAVALGKLGDKRAAGLLHDLLRDGGQNLARMSAIATALGFIGDRHSIDPLIGMLHDESLTPLSRAFAAVALGGIADKEMLPWNSKIAFHMNYRAAVETLTNRVSGILDIL